MKGRLVVFVLVAFLGFILPFFFVVVLVVVVKMVEVMGMGE